MHDSDPTGSRIGSPSRSTASTLPIGPGTELPGAEVIALTGAGGVEVGKILGRVIARDLPCVVESARGLGCAETDGTLLIRHPVSGLNLPGEHVVGQTQFCPRCGPGLPRVVTPTRQERSDGWAPGTTN